MTAVLRLQPRRVAFAYSQLPEIATGRQQEAVSRSLRLCSLPVQLASVSPAPNTSVELEQLILVHRDVFVLSKKVKPSTTAVREVKTS